MAVAVEARYPNLLVPPFKPSLISIAATLFVAVSCLNLSAWQLRRYSEAEAIAASREGAVHSEPLTDLTGEDLEWHQVELTGSFTEEQPFVVAGGIAHRTAGYVIIEPFQVDGGPELLVQRGWIPVEDWAEIVAATRPVGPMTVRGVVRKIEGDQVVEPLPTKEGAPPLWPLEKETFLYYFTRGNKIPYRSMANSLDRELSPLYIVAGPELQEPHDRRVDRLPAAGFLWRKKTFHHLDYAGQWALFALIAVAIWVWAGIRRGRRLQEPEA